MQLPKTSRRLGRVPFILGEVSGAAMKRILPLLLCLSAWPALATAPKPLLPTRPGRTYPRGLVLQLVSRRWP